MNKEQKAAVVEEVATQIQDSEAVFAVDYRGISVPQAAELRERLNEAGARFRVVKNTLTIRAVEQAGADHLKELLEGPTAFTFVAADGGDVALAAKALSQFRRANQLLEFKGGWMNGAALSAAEIDAIAQLPSREVLYGRLVGMVASPLTGLVSALDGLIGGLARQLQAMADQGLVGAGAPAPAASASETPPEETAGDPDAGPTESADDPGPEPDPAPEETPAETTTEEDN